MHASLPPVLILPDAVYDDGMVYLALGISPAALATARKSGALQFKRCGRRTIYLGSWLLEWLRGDSVRELGDA